jgi:FkbM family methyltransferase
MYPKGQIAKGIYCGWFEKGELDLFQKFLKPGMHVVDAGANIGLYSIISSFLVGKSGKVISFEPSKKTFELFSSNIKLNKVENVQAFNLGLGENVDEKLYLRQDLGYGDAERYIIPNNEDPNPELSNVKNETQKEEILLDSLDNMVGKLCILKIDFIKIDTEGFEFYVLKGAKNVIKTNPQIIIMMECTALGTKRANTTQEEVFEFLKDNGLKVFYRNTIAQQWSYDEIGALNSPDGMVWACRDIEQLINVTV